MPEISVKHFGGSTDEFFRLAEEYFKSNSQYRGYEQLRALVQSKNLNEYELFLAQCDAVPAGLAAARLQESTIILDVFAVQPGFRGIGIGDVLFEEIVKHHKFSEATNYESMALPGDRSTKNFFEQRKGKARLLIINGVINR